MTQLSPQLAIYSADPSLTLSQLKAWNYDPELDTSKIQNYAAQHQIQGTSKDTSNFPSKLKTTKSSPPLLYYQGNLSLLDKDLLAIVGPRNPSDYAQQVMQSFFEKAKNYQICTISGFARGIDQVCHRLSLQHNIPTIAILGGGFEHYLKSRDRSLLEDIIKQGGLVISQFKIGFEPTKRSFPMRNKLIAQLAKTVFLPEAKEKSGSLITTEFAYEYKKPVYSVPAPIFAQHSAGIFQKMQEEKIKLITDFDQALSQHFQIFSEAQNTKTNTENLDPRFADLILHLRQHWTSSLEKLMEVLGKSYSELLQSITLLEMQGILSEIQPNIYQLK